MSKAFRLALALACFCGTAMGQGAALAQGNCAPLSIMHEQLTGSKFQERLMGVGVLGMPDATQGPMVRLYVSEYYRSFSILIVHPSGLACFHATGGSFDFVKATPQGRKADKLL